MTARGLIVNRKKRRDDATLFPGYALDEYVIGEKSASTMIGNIFECLTSNLLGGERRTTNSTADICPDAIDERRGLWAESKGCQRQHAFKVPARQIDGYLQAQLDAAIWGNRFQVVYALWTYTAKRISKARDWQVNGHVEHRIPTRREFIELVLSETKCVHIIDLSVIRRVCQLCEGTFKMRDRNEGPPTCSVTTYESWRDTANGEHYYSLNVGHRFLASLKTDAPGTLIKMDLYSCNYRYKTHVVDDLSVTVDGIEFKLPPVEVFELLRPEGWIEHPEAENMAPF